jgi:uncharacterized protein
LDNAAFEKYIQNIHSFFSPEVPLCIIFHGGEPLLAGYEFYEKVFEFLNGLDRKIHKGIQTNLTLLDDRTIELFKKNECTFGSSLDGDEETNDLTRKMYGGKGSYKLVAKKLNKLNSAFSMPTGVLSVLHEHNMNAERYYNFAKSTEAYQIGFCPMFEYRNSISNSADMDTLSNFLIELFDLWVGDENNPPRLNFFESIMHSLLGRNPVNSCLFSEDCTRSMMAVDVSGDVYLCTHFLGQTEYSYGNALTEPFDKIWNSDVRNTLKQRTERVSDSCGNCSYFKICFGGCMAHTIDSLNDKDYFCKAYQKLYKHIESVLDGALAESEA